MRVRLKLYATLGDYLPAGAKDNVAEIEVPDGACAAEIIERFSLPPRLVHLVLVNGVFVPPEERASARLTDGDTLAIWPPIAGG